MNSTKWRACKSRFLRVLLFWTGLFGAGITYGVVLRVTGVGIPCMFRLVTGLKCPGCGVSHMALRLMAGDIPGAFRENQAVFCLLPLGGILAGRCSVRYVRSGTKKLSRFENGMAVFMIVVLVGYGILRNFPIFP